jgi:hypothetical protein
VPEGGFPHETELGRGRSAPIPCGWLFVEGCYIEAPYMVERRGLAILVNGYLVETVSDAPSEPGPGGPEGGPDVPSRVKAAFARAHATLGNGAFVVVENGRTMASHVPEGGLSTWRSIVSEFLNTDMEGGSNMPVRLRYLQGHGLFPREMPRDRLPEAATPYRTMLERLRAGPQFWVRLSDDDLWRAGLSATGVPHANRTECSNVE